MQQPTAREQQALANEWERMQGMARRLSRQGFIATIGGMAVVCGGFVLSALLYFFWPLHKIPIVFLVAPIAFSVGIGWKARTKLWPKGQFG